MLLNRPNHTSKENKTNRSTSFPPSPYPNSYVFCFLAQWRNPPRAPSIHPGMLVARQCMISFNLDGLAGWLAACSLLLDISPLYHVAYTQIHGTLYRLGYSLSCPRLGYRLYFFFYTIPISSLCPVTFHPTFTILFVPSSHTSLFSLHGLIVCIPVILLGYRTLPFLVLL